MNETQSGAKVRLRPSTTLAIAAIASAAAFAAGRASAPTPAASLAERASDERGVASPAAETVTLSAPVNEALPPGHPPIEGSGDLAMPGAALGSPASQGDPAPAALEWKAPSRWQRASEPNPMRLATYRVPSPDGKGKEAELSVSQAGGSIAANADRWVGQFDEGARRAARRSTRRIAGLEITLVEIEGTYAGGMGASAGPKEGWALVGAIVATAGMPHFFKLTGPIATVRAARAEFDALLASLAQT